MRMCSVRSVKWVMWNILCCEKFGHRREQSDSVKGVLSTSHIALLEIPSVIILWTCLNTVKEWMGGRDESTVKAPLRFILAILRQPKYQKQQSQKESIFSNPVTSSHDLSCRFPLLIVIEFWYRPLCRSFFPKKDPKPTFNSFNCGRSNAHCWLMLATREFQLLQSHERVAVNGKSR